VRYQGAYRSWKVMEFKIQIFEAWKLVELGLGPDFCFLCHMLISLRCAFSRRTLVAAQ